MFNSGILAVIFVLGGVLVTLMLPVLLNQISRWRFARRFERLVEANQIVPILTRDVEDAKTRSTQQRKRVSMESLLDAWIGGHHAPSRSQEWKPLAAAFISRQDERPVTAAILTNKAQRAEARLWLRSIHHRRDTVGQSRLQQEALKRQQTNVPADRVAQTAGKLRFGASTAEKGTGRCTRTATVSPPQGLTPRVLGEDSERETGAPHSSFGDMRGLWTLSAIEIGVAEQNFDQAPGILELVADDDGDARASAVSPVDDDELNEMNRVLAARTPASRYPIIYGRPHTVTRPMYANPLPQQRNRVY